MGSMDMNHLRVLRDIDDERVQAVGVADTHEPHLRRAISRYHIPGYAEFPIIN
jgi:predicted dehydrogenase